MEQLTNGSYSISIYLDTRRQKANGKYPVKLRVFISSIRRQKLYPTKFEYTEKEFQAIWQTSRPRNENKAARLQLQALLVKANEVADQLDPFTFDQFEKFLFRKPGEGQKVAYHYSEFINELREAQRVGTRQNYEYSQASIKAFVESKGRKYETLTFQEISKDWLHAYERWMLEDQRKSISTVGFYLRPLRSIFNKAIAEQEVSQDLYPFGKRRYQIPATRNKKKALKNTELKKLYEATPLTPYQQMAKDFWFFSFACNGMNIKDIAKLTYKDIQNDKIEFIRAKTKLTTKTDSEAITVYLNDFTRGVIDRYKTDTEDKEAYVFSILSDNMTPEERQKKIKAFVRFINQHIKLLSLSVGLTGEISTYWARHSFATKSVRSGASLEFMQEALGHKDLKTTQNYFAGFDDDTKKDLANKIMDF